MKPKTLTVLYWVFTSLFAILMLVSAASGIQPSASAIKIIHDGLGYPVYFIQLLSIAKILGVIALLVPRLKRVKEWAYAGLFFDLAGAFYSGIAAAGKFDPLILTMAIWIVPGILSYYYWHRRLATHGN
jgi:DoxX-like family